MRDTIIMKKIVKQYIGIKYNATGIFGYSFREGGTELFHISCPALPNPDIALAGFQKKLWHRNYDGQITLAPGVRRNVVDESGKMQGYYRYVGINEFDIVIEKATARVRAFEDGWSVFIETTPVAEILRLTESERNRFEENGYDMEERFQVNILEDTDFSLYPYIMAIPILRF